MDQFYQQNQYGKIPLEFDHNFSELHGELPNHTEKRQLMLHSTVVGLCVILFILLQNYLPSFIIGPNLARIYLSSDIAAMAMDILFSLIGIFIPFVIGGFFVKKITPDVEVFPYKKPYSKSLFFIAIAIGAFALLISNYITTVFVYAMENVGVEITSPSDELFTGGFGQYAMCILRGAVTPALIEEFAFRGVVMQPLRKFGDTFAIVVSSFMFAIMHGNMVQAPFAFILGCAIGYLVVVTGSLWTGVAIHFINNAFSITMSAVSSQMGFESYYKVFTVISIIMFVFGVGATIWYVLNRRRYPSLNKRGGVSKQQRRQYSKSAVKTYLISPALLIAIGILIYNMTDYIKLGG